MKESQVFLTRKTRFTPAGGEREHELEVTISGRVNASTGMLFPLQELDSIIAQQLAEQREAVATVEDLVRDLWGRLEPKLRRNNARL